MTTQKSILEIYVANYLRLHPKTHSNFLNKTIRMIQDEIDYQCCFDAPVHNYFTDKENELTRTVYRILLQIGLHNNLKSFQRTIDLINKHLINCCVV